MAGKIVSDLGTKTDAAWANLTRQLQGMEPHMERADAPGEWTTREVLSHLLFQDGWRPADTLRTFSRQDLPLVEVVPSQTFLNDARRRMTLTELIAALEAQRREVFRYLESVPEADLAERKARIPLFKQFMGTDEISIAVYVGALLDFHWNDHAGQLAKIRAAVGLA